MQDIGYIGYKASKIGDLKFTPIVTGDPMSSGIATLAATAVATIIDSINKGRPNPNDWMGWNALDNQMGYPIGTNVTGWILQDGDSIQNEALNILQYIRQYGTNNVLTYNSHWNKTITVQDIADKLSRGGYQNEANQLFASSPVQDITNTFSSTSNLLLYAGIGLAIILLIKK